jgi:uncharacterized protein YuzE
MKFNYDKETGSLYINFINVAGVDSFEVSEDFIADVNEKGQMVGLEVLNVKDKVDVSSMIFNDFPASDIRFTREHAS